MGNYNPHAPYILGNEWVPIKESYYEPDVDTELGYTFSIGHQATVVSGGIFMETPPLVEFGFQSHMVTLYRAGEEDHTGPARKLVIPCNGGATRTGSITIVGSSIADALANAADGKYVLLGDLTGGGAEFSVFFDTLSYSNQLSGKRILNVDLLYIAAGTAPDGVTTSLSLKCESTAASSNEMILAEQVPVATSLETVPGYMRIPLGNTNPYAGISLDDQRRYPWVYDDLLRFRSGATNELELFFDSSGYIITGASVSDIKIVYITYAALEITYCEENRIAFGGRATTAYDPTSAAAQGPFIQGQNKIHLRTPSAAVTGVAMTPGQYTVTVGMADMGAQNNVGAKPLLRAVRQLYELPSHPGLQITRSLREGGVPTVAESQVLPAISLHTRAAVVTGSHVYGEVIGAPIYGSGRAIQEVYAGAGIGPSTSTPYPQVRFYARRFGDTDVPLTLTGLDDPNGASVTLTVEEFDALPEIVDGWKEVTLRFTGFVPSMSSGATSPDWRWTATGLAAGNQWQVLGGRGAGVAGGVFDPDASNYGAPFGDLVTLEWDGTNDDSADAVLIFSQDPPAVTGLAVVVAEQELTSIGQECATTPECVPTSLYYHQVTWLPIFSLPATGFGYYELQRRDDDGEPDTWDTILHATSRTVTGYADYEARVGVESYYRIRVANVLEFFGSWSNEQSSTLTSPGVNGITSDGNSVLIFTTNEIQDGTANLAYVQTWDGDVSEDFEFPEAGAVKAVERYNRDFVTVFRPTERGGERFTRLLLVQNAAVTTGRMRDGFRSLRDMAWENVSYTCVRNELGDRWLASVQVPSGRIQRNRRLYLAQVTITEVTDTPCVVELPEE